MDKDIKLNSAHLLSLKVMRLTKPSLASSVVLTNDPKDLPHNIFNNELKKDITSVQGSETFASGQFLLIPQSFGNIYLGETFSSYIFVHNDSTEVAKNVCFKVDLQTTTGKVSLSSSEAQGIELVPGDTVDRVINHEVKEIGHHMLICEVSYINPSGEQCSFKKFFKFPVHKPLDLKTKFYNDESDDVFLEAQVLNLTTGPIHLECVSLETSKLFSVMSLNSKEESQPGGCTLQPDGSRQYLYCLTPTPKLTETNVNGATNIGKLDIVWRSNLGERGRLQTSQLHRTAVDYGDIRLSACQLPSMVKLEEPFEFSCKVFNLSKRSMNLRLELEKVHPGLVWIGLSGRDIGTLEAGSTVVLKLTMVALSSGLHNVSGIRLKDTLLNRAYPYDEVAQVFVS